MFTENEGLLSACYDERFVPFNEGVIVGTAISSKSSMSNERFTFSFNISAMDIEFGLLFTDTGSDLSCVFMSVSPNREQWLPFLVNLNVVEGLDEKA